jgi:hypothetical protein
MKCSLDLRHRVGGKLQLPLPVVAVIVYGDAAPPIRLDVRIALVDVAVERDGGLGGGDFADGDCFHDQPTIGSASITWTAVQAPAKKANTWDSSILTAWMVDRRLLPSWLSVVLLFDLRILALLFPQRTVARREALYQNDKLGVNQYLSKRLKLREKIPVVSIQQA